MPAATLRLMCNFHPPREGRYIDDAIYDLPGNVERGED